MYLDDSDSILFLCCIDVVPSCIVKIDIVITLPCIKQLT